MALSTESISLFTMLTDIASMFRAQADAKSLRVEFDLDRRLPPYVKTDANKLERILVNLLSNAVKFTEEGIISLNVAIEDEYLSGTPKIGDRYQLEL